ncbi:MAG TPA: hypothetical protein VMI06_09305 [Terriglobia bacterium]|nr:hypothetical protein [Terriglobia bacterium]
MIDMGFGSFLTLAVISLITASIVHYGFKYGFLEGFDGFLGKWIVAWVAAWVASPVLGYWFAGVKLGSIYVIPAFLGGFIGAFFPALTFKALAKAQSSRTYEAHEIHGKAA